VENTPQRPANHHHTVPPTKCPACGKSFGRLVQQAAQAAALFHSLGDSATDAEIIAGTLIQLTVAVNALTRAIKGAGETSE